MFGKEEKGNYINISHCKKIGGEKEEKENRISFYFVENKLKRYTPHNLEPRITIHTHTYVSGGCSEFSRLFMRVNV